MARKKVTKKSGRKKVSRRSSSSKSKNNSVKKVSPVVKERKTYAISLGIAVRNLISFLILFIFSSIFYSFSEEVLFLRIFGILGLITGFIALAFLITTLVLIFVRMIKKR
jgi:uncharacterized Tic20 family protein